ncbi:MAG: bifunctional chorismate mutase/prephenate dehydratase [Fusobacteria bacterium]|nr:MAG: bifunctional chorismate mutase/prephenate dehydratase [Fusobacteriota bacterium]
MAKLFEERMKVVEGIARYKQSVGMKILDDSREKEVIENNSKRVDSPLKKYYIEFLKDNMKLSREFQKEILGLGKQVGYQGIKGSFSYLALKSKYTDAVSKSYESFEGVFQGVKEKEIEVGVLPIENSFTGDITDNFDLLRKYDAYIVDTIDLKIDHNLLGIKGAKLEDIKEVYSHIQGFKQSQKFLLGRNYKEIPYYNTAISAKHISEQQDKSKGAIASRETAKIYNLDILAPNINTHEDNTTKFMVIADTLKVEKNHDRVMVAFSTFNRSGDLSEVLGEFARYSINMLSIKSRPLKNSSWEYVFFVELEGNYEKLKEGLEAVKKQSKIFRVIGSYEK